MNSRVERWVAVQFESIPFSEQAKRAQEKIGIALDAMYSAFVAECKDADAAWDELMRKYPTLTAMAEAAEYTPQDVAAWRTDGEVVGLRVVRRNMRRLRGLVYVLALFWAIAFAELCWAVYDLFTAPPYAALALAIAILFLVCGALVLRVVVNKAAALRRKKCDIPAYTYLCAQYDRYLKRGLNGIALSAVLLASFLLSAVFGARPAVRRLYAQYRDSVGIYLWEP